MLQSRILPRIISISGNLYVFGGLLFQQHLKKAEKCCIPGQTWKRLSDSNKPHHSFCPCNYEGVIYLSPARIYHCFEAFIVARECFSMIDLKGATSFLRPVSMVVDGYLYLIGTNGYLVKWRIGTSGANAEMGTMEGRYGQIFTASCGPVVQDREVTWLDLGKPGKWTLTLDLQFLVHQHFALPG